MAQRREGLDELPASCLSPCGPPNPAELYSEARRLALEELLAGGPDAFEAFLRRERLGRFLSREEVRAVLRAAEGPGRGGAAAGPEDSFGSSLDCSSGTYFPEQSDLEPPPLELGWPAFYRGAYRGATRVEAHFQPRGAGSGGPHGCKDALRQQLRAAREVIAVVMDVFTDIDIFKDLQEISRKQGVAVYILLDQALLSQFLDMCMDLKVHPEQEKLMTVRTITGNTYYARSGTKIVGQVHEKFTLIDGIRVATGSYSFTWTDGKLNSSNLVILSGQVVEHFDLEFRILYAESKPISSKLLSDFQISGRFDHLVDRKPLAKELTLGGLLRLRLARLSSTPKKAELGYEAPAEGKAEARRHDSESSTVSDEDLNGLRDKPEGRRMTEAATQTEPGEEAPAVSRSDVATQASMATACAGTQTMVTTRAATSQTVVRSTSATTQTDVDENVLFSQGTQSKEGSPVSRMSVSRSSSLRSSSSVSSQGSVASSLGSQASSRAADLVPSGHAKFWGTPHLDLCLRDSFRNLNQERQFHFAGIRSRLNNMLSMLSRRTFLTENYLGFHSGNVTRASVNLLAVRDIALYPTYQ
ncbi:protein FAM83D [Canis lupus baileyi]|uniref:Family with sequence similarity 83 member D n=3 Tax=Canis lupus TaxID=9612 RepID=A0A8C0RD96_CANLF|nr:protein FAM83D [Canis lupus familiaris]XP_025325849.1 protein FAM83D [Canis lupus dingo]XP_038289756.1 protein FAM83D [Canis lupus familiaris]XP_038428240.1 protein FAM83D [Canis lupus familiaris]